MEIINLPNDILNLIIDISNGYKLMYVCNKFKNIMYKRLTKCNICNKNVTFDNNNLWTTSIFNKCHTMATFIEENPIIIDSYDDVNEFMFTLGMISNLNKIGKLVIDNDVIIFAKNERAENGVYVSRSTNKNLENMKGVYSINYTNFSHCRHIHYGKGNMSIICYNNKYTKNTRYLKFNIKSQCTSHFFDITKL